MASLPVMGLLANNHLGERGLFAYVDLKCGVATIYVPFVSSADAAIHIEANCVGPTSMRKALSRPEQDEHGTSQTSIRHHPRLRSAMSQYAVAPIHTGGVAMRHVGPRDATFVPLSILTWNLTLLVYRSLTV